MAIAPVAQPAAANLAGMNEFIGWELNADIPGATKIDLNPYLAPGYKYTEYLTFPEGCSRFATTSSTSATWVLRSPDT